MKFIAFFAAAVFAFTAPAYAKTATPSLEAAEITHAICMPVMSIRQKAPWKDFCAYHKARYSNGLKLLKNGMATGYNSPFQISPSRVVEVTMISKFCMAVCISASAHFSTTDVAQKAEVMVSSTERRIAEGAWVGKFLQKNWAFDLKVENGVWSGKYMIDNKGNWHPLDDVHISDRSVSFNMETQPKVSFSLVIGADNLAMSGTVNIDGVATVPFSAVRKP